MISQSSHSSSQSSSEATPVPNPEERPEAMPAAPAPRAESGSERDGESDAPSVPNPVAPSAASGPGITTAPTRPRPTRPTPQKLPPWQVLLHNDDMNDMDYVVGVLERVARLQRPAATRCMVEAHRRGIGLVLTTHRERAELLAELFRSCRLVVTIEPLR